MSDKQSLLKSFEEFCQTLRSEHARPKEGGVSHTRMIELIELMQEKYQMIATAMMDKAKSIHAEAPEHLRDESLYLDLKSIARNHMQQYQLDNHPGTRTNK